MKTLTVFTPTYNRSYCLEQCYRSLVGQGNQDFIWMIIDDGSNDTTKQLVEHWIEENLINIEYYYQENKGMHGAHNLAYELIETELNVCIDSDDFVADNAIDKILKFWRKVDKNNLQNIAGIIGLDADKKGSIIGKRIPDEIVETTVEDLYFKHRISGDKKLIYRTEIIKKYPLYPTFDNERFVPLGTLYLLIDKDYQMLCLNEVLCVVEYMKDGSSKNIIKQYYKHPKGFQYARKINMKYSNYYKVKFKNAIHYVSHGIQILDFEMFFKSPKPFLTLLAVPFGILLYFHVKYINILKK